MNAKDLLLSLDQPVPVTRTLLGGEFKIIRMTAERLSQYEKKRKKYSEEQDVDKLNEAVAQLVLDSILDDNGLPMSQSVKPKELLAVKTMTSIESAIRVITAVNYMAEGSEEAAKKG
ncbi:MULTISPECIES: hypothetical protein [Vibrio harveyi group]|uniref:hypothetical protein n=1 Tax=Vibrio harveyi group TaxID=717610 RepID=UPI001AD81852|nr:MULTISPECIES: hypothetical protein [Vibrio harveyi group]EGQ8125751.1 hypothetical protein [Vibrio parahaemolyticus]MBS9912018.1 hypothetical protein [Vibrio alginolyticus]MBT0049752.1 hypothetical protein [Vibrio alginolyticus]MBT0063634.1 hypothetical protein [Vibrio alginolyticus]QRH11484.1 hypothetical protein JCT84_08195 [Vibrio parahaemolyticus]